MQSCWPLAVSRNANQQRYRVVLVMLLLFVAGAVACTTEAKFENVYQVVSPATLQPGAAIPVPEQTPILTITGKVKARNGSQGEQVILMDRDTIEQVGAVAYTATDPFEERPIRFQGVLMRDLLAIWQVADDAQMVHLVALNDYVVEIPINELREFPVLFALQADDIYMEPDYRGPAMLVYPLDHYQFDSIAMRKKWIWQIAAIDIQ